MSICAYDWYWWNKEEHKEDAKLFREYTHNVIVFEEIGIALQKTEELYTQEVDNDIQNIVRALNVYRVVFGETNQKPLADVMFEIITYWNDPEEYAGPSKQKPLTDVKFEIITNWNDPEEHAGPEFKSQHTSSYVVIRQHMSTYGSVCRSRHGNACSVIQQVMTTQESPQVSVFALLY